MLAPSASHLLSRVDPLSQHNRAVGPVPEGLERDISVHGPHTAACSSHCHGQDERNWKFQEITRYVISASFTLERFHRFHQQCNTVLRIFFFTLLCSIVNILSQKYVLPMTESQSLTIARFQPLDPSYTARRGFASGLGRSSHDNQTLKRKKYIDYIR